MHPRIVELNLEIKDYFRRIERLIEKKRPFVLEDERIQKIKNEKIAQIKALQKIKRTKRHGTGSRKKVPQQSDDRVKEAAVELVGEHSATIY